MDQVAYNVSVVLKKFPEIAFESEIVEAMDKLTVSITWHLYSEEIRVDEIYQHPATWWEAFKFRWMPWCKVAFTEVPVVTIHRRMYGQVPFTESMVDGQPRSESVQNQVGPRNRQDFPSF